MPPLEISAPDPSLGKSKELFNMTLVDERAMCVKLSPPRLDTKTMKELVEATLDVIQLPGASPTDTTDTTELVGALKEIAEEKRTDWMEEWPCILSNDEPPTKPPSSLSRTRPLFKNAMAPSRGWQRKCSRHSIRDETHLKLKILMRLEICLCDPPKLAT